MKPYSEISPSCALCETGRLSPDGAKILCTRHGVMDKSDKCNKFSYDPLKREPQLPQKQKFQQSDFDL